MATRHVSFCFFVAVLLAHQASARGNPVPLVNSPLSPESIAPGSPGFTLTVNGTGFVSGAVVNWNGHARATAFVSASQLTATILASDVASAGTSSVDVTNPAPGGGTSNIVFFQVRMPASAVAFAASATYSVSGAYRVATADLNGDGKLDLVIGSQTVDSVAVMLGNGDGTFQSPVNFATGDHSYFVAIADFNNDVVPDLAVGHPSSSVDILLGNGDGTFQPYRSFPASGGSYSITVGDFNADGNLDLAVLGFSPRVTVLLGNGDGTFQPGTDYHLKNSIVTVVTGDFNRDGRLDLAVAGSGGASILLGNGDGTFQTPFAIFGNFLSLAVADFNGDGTVDLAVSTSNGTIAILLGNGDATFRNAGNYHIGPSAGLLVVGDFNGDGKIDLAAPAGGNNVSTIAILLGNGDGTFQAPTSSAGQQGYPSQMAAGDFVGNGELDVALIQFNAVSIDLTTTAGVSPSLVSFKATVLGTTRSTTVTVSDLGTSPLTITQVGVSGPNAAAFSLANNTCQGATLPASGQCTIDLAFSPNTTGALTAFLTIGDDAIVNPQVAALSGDGTAIELIPARLNFGGVKLGSISQPKIVMATNTGSKVFSIGQISMMGSGAQEFLELNTCGQSLVPKAVCSIVIWFIPTSTGVQKASLSFMSSGAPQADPNPVPVSGTGN